MVPDDRSDEPRFSAVRPTAEEGDFLEDIPDLDQRELRTDTLEFEPVRRRTPKRRPGVRSFVLIVALVVIAGGAWGIWGELLTGGATNSIPIVRAPSGPIKVRPDSPGGINIPNRDKLVYDRLEKKPPERQAETLLPQPEKPLPAPGAESLVSAPGATSAPAVGLEDILQPTPPARPSKSVEQVVLPAPGKTVPAPSASTEPPTVAEVQAARPPKPSLPSPASGTSAASPEPGRPSATTPAKSGDTAAFAQNFQVQLAAVRDEQAAAREWKRLQSRNAGLLSGLKLNVVRADLGDRGVYYRLRAGPISERAAAVTLCQSLAKAKVGCLVVRPGG